MEKCPEAEKRVHAESSDPITKQKMMRCRGSRGSRSLTHRPPGSAGHVPSASGRAGCERPGRVGLRGPCGARGTRRRSADRKPGPGLRETPQVRGAGPGPPAPTPSGRAGGGGAASTAREAPGDGGRRGEKSCARPKRESLLRGRPSESKQYGTGWGRGAGGFRQLQGGRRGQKAMGMAVPRCPPQSCGESPAAERPAPVQSSSAAGGTASIARRRGRPRGHPMGDAARTRRMLPSGPVRSGYILGSFAPPGACGAGPCAAWALGGAGATSQAER